MGIIMEDGVIVFDEVSLVRHRMINLFQGYNIRIYEVSYENELFNLISNTRLNISLIIMDIGNDANKGFGILSKIKEKREDIPIFILTSNSRRETFVRGIAEGAADYILKPFDDAYLLEKVLNILKKKNNSTGIQVNSNSAIVFDFQTYLKTEFKKASKGNYSISVLMCTFFLPVDTFSIEIENKYIHVSNLFYIKFKSILWDTDIFERYGSQIFIGIFPFCGIDNVDKVINKIRNSFDEVKQENKELDDFELAVISITYPEESEDARDLLYTLGVRMKKTIDEIKRSLIT